MSDYCITSGHHYMGSYLTTDKYPNIAPNDITHPFVYLDKDTNMAKAERPFLISDRNIYDCQQPLGMNGKWTIQHVNTGLYLGPSNGVATSGAKLGFFVEPFYWDAWPFEASVDITGVLDKKDYCNVYVDQTNLVIDLDGALGGLLPPYDLVLVEKSEIGYTQGFSFVPVI